MDLPIPHAEKAVLIVLGEAANKYTHRCWPSVATIMRRTSFTRRTVQTALRQLEAWEIIISEGRDTSGARSGSTIYTVHIGKVVDTAQSERRNHSALSGAIYDLKGRNLRH
jgi:hypothetical protein